MIKKTDLKTGMLVETEDSVLRVVLGNTLISYKDGGCDLQWYDEDLNINISVSNNCKIKKVYSEPYCSGGLCADLKFWLDEKNALNYSKLLWKKN